MAPLLEGPDFPITLLRPLERSGGGNLLACLNESVGVVEKVVGGIDEFDRAVWVLLPQFLPCVDYRGPKICGAQK